MVAIQGSKVRGPPFLRNPSVTQSPLAASSAPVRSIAFVEKEGGVRRKRRKEKTEQMNTQRRLRRITIASSLVGLAIGFLLLGILILSNQNGEDALIAGGVVGILLGTAFLMLACSYWRNEALKL